jgi:hypothetical protein
VKGLRPKGSPVAFTVADDGSIFLVEDKNRTIVRLAHSERALEMKCGRTEGIGTIDPRIELLAWRNALENSPTIKAGYEGVRETVLKKYCASCHGGFVENEIASDGYSQLDYLVKNEMFVAKKSMASKIYQALAHTGEVPAMPPADVPFPDGREGAALVDSVKTWIDALPADLEKSVQKKTMRETRKIRSAAAASGKECGQVSAGDVIYTDPRVESQQKRDGWIWAKVYMLPGDSRLFRGACAYPVDGVFYMATVKQ